MLRAVWDTLEAYAASDQDNDQQSDQQSDQVKRLHVWSRWFQFAPEKTVVP
jgi:hypothetical protein